ncbi:hypothetical protein V6N12_069431 [Hibiscus sabdariffa]|uniref:Uncharacterized protein n=1 Tax=Hibiscus sabdariffa TaxID=183260 RepID=A0ABR2FDW7_9ROSI
MRSLGVKRSMPRMQLVYHLSSTNIKRACEKPSHLSIASPTVVFPVVPFVTIDESRPVIDFFPFPRREIRLGESTKLTTRPLNRPSPLLLRLSSPIDNTATLKLNSIPPLFSKPESERVCEKPSHLSIASPTVVSLVVSLVTVDESTSIVNFFPFPRREIRSGESTKLTTRPLNRPLSPLLRLSSPVGNTVTLKLNFIPSLFSRPSFDHKCTQIGTQNHAVLGGTVHHRSMLPSNTPVVSNLHCRDG